MQLHDEHHLVENVSFHIAYLYQIHLTQANNSSLCLTILDRVSIMYTFFRICGIFLTVRSTPITGHGKKYHNSLFFILPDYPPIWPPPLYRLTTPSLNFNIYQIHLLCYNICTSSYNITSSTFPNL